MTKEKITQHDREAHDINIWNPYTLGILLFITLITAAYAGYWWGNRPHEQSLQESAAPHASEVPTTGTEAGTEHLSSPTREEIEPHIINMEEHP